MEKRYEWILKIKAISEANSSEHWTKSSKRHKAQKWAVKKAFLEHRPSIELPCKIKISRIAPRSLDTGDNLPTSVKYIRDALSENILHPSGVDENGKKIRPGMCDNDLRLIWEYGQEKGRPREYLVKVEIYF